MLRGKGTMHAGLLCSLSSLRLQTRLRFLAALSLLAGAVAGAQEEPASAGLRSELRGYARSRFSVFSPLDGADWNLQATLRPELVLFVAERLSATLTVAGHRLAGRSEELLGQQGSFRVERAFLDATLGRLDVRVGRQAINFGSALIWNPVDLADFNTPFDFNVEKRGVDALRAAAAISATSSVLGLMAFPEQGGSRRVISLLRAEALVGSTNLALMAAQDGRSDEFVLGLDAKGDLGLGLWLEGAAHLPQERDAYYDVVLGADYSFAVLDRLVVAAQVRRDSSGGTGVEDYDCGALLRGRSFLARQYGSLLGTLAASELLSGTASLIYNFEDASFITTGSVTRVFFENLEATLRISLLRGSGPGEFNPVEGSPLEGQVPRESYELWLEWRF
jgi:hypothetical protein